MTIETNDHPSSQVEVGPAMSPRERRISGLIDYACIQFEAAVADKDVELAEAFDHLLDELVGIEHWAKQAA